MPGLNLTVPQAARLWDSIAASATTSHNAHRSPGSDERQQVRIFEGQEVSPLLVPMAIQTPGQTRE